MRKLDTYPYSLETRLFRARAKIMLRKLVAVALLSVTCITVTGCGLSDYESRMAASLAELQEKTRYESLFGPTKVDTLVGNPEEQDLVELPITIRLPKIFGPNDWFRPGSAYRYRHNVVPEDVLYPPFLGEFPGLNRTAETYAEAEERNFLAYYCYLGVLESRTHKFEKVLADLRNKTAAKIKNTTAWQDVDCKDEHLVATKWKMLEAKGLQDFLNRSEQMNGVPGTFRVYAREDQGYIILFAVRIPNSLIEKVTLLDLADAVAGTVQITAPAPTEPAATDPAATDPKTPPMPDAEETTPPKASPSDATPAETPPASDPAGDTPPAAETPATDGEPAPDAATAEEPATPSDDAPTTPAEESNPDAPAESPEN
jgi:hypothetical protein